MFIDSHCHLDSNELFENLDIILKRAFNNQIKYLITIGCNHDKWDQTIKIVETKSNVYGCIGLHPHEAKSWSKNMSDILYKKIKSSNRIKGLGEIGLDYYYLDRNKDIETQKQVQKKCFIEQIDLAVSNNLPIVIHTREAEEDTYNILKDFRGEKILIHCFSGSADFAQKIDDLGFYISFSGIVTFDKSGQLDSVIKKFPVDRILIETDSPYLAPMPVRGKPNEPSNLKYVFYHIRKTVDLSELELKRQLLENTKSFFSI